MQASDILIRLEEEVFSRDLDADDADEGVPGLAFQGYNPGELTITPEVLAEIIMWAQDADGAGMRQAKTLADEILEDIATHHATKIAKR